MGQLWKLSGSIRAQFGGRKHPFVISHLETSEAGSAPPCLLLPRTGQGHGQPPGGEQPQDPCPVACLAHGGGLSPWGSPKGEWNCPPCHPDGSAPNVAVP